ncbi:MAG: response regulator [Flavobacteriales bacterium]|nr:response regulator [Flavobacteriales bacterium]MCB9363717.1 response regulator [Flavobacteriales bacterium]
MKKITVGVVEDEVIIANSIISSLEFLGYNTVGPALNYTQGLEMLANDKPDIILLDIILSGNKNGIDLAWEIRERFNVPFIFLTSHADKATIDKAKQVSPPAYLVKPFNKDELYSAIEIALYNFNNHEKNINSSKEIDSKSANYLMNDSLFIKHKGSYQKIPFVDIVYLKNDNIYIEINTTQGVYLVRSNMNEYLQKLPDNFIRIHRSYAINATYLERINNETVFINQEELPISRNYKEELLSKINIG